MKKLMSMLLVGIVLFNFIFCNNVYASAEFSAETEGEPITSTELQDLIEGGEANYSGEGVKMEFTPFKSLFGTIAGILAAFFNIFPGLIELVMAVCVEESFTIEKTVFGEIAMFDINYFNTSGQYTIGTGEREKTIATRSTTKAIKTSVARFYYIIRLIAVAISLLILIYVGIRMAISTIAEDKAKYKKMLIGWIESIIILFILQYIISAIFGIGKIFQNLIYDLKCLVISSQSVSFENEIADNLMSWMVGKAGWNYLMYSIIFWILVYIQTKFCIMYFKRLITVGFLILIAPLITVTYPIDKIGDGKAQAFSIWLNEMMMNVFIQPIHAIIYLIFMFTAGEIAKISAWIGLVFLLLLTKIEKIILQLFNLKKASTLKPISEHRKVK